MKARNRLRHSRFRPTMQRLEERVVMDVGGLDALLLNASAAIVTTDTGEVIGDLNPNDQRGMASTTKIMTALLALELTAPGNPHGLSLNDEVVIGAYPIFVGQIGSGFADYKLGEKVVLEDLLHAVMRVSDNTGAQAVAEHLVMQILGADQIPTPSGETTELTIRGLIDAGIENAQETLSELVDVEFAIGANDVFATWMNSKAEALGMDSTHFLNPRGFDVVNHYSTATDMATLTRYAMNESQVANEFSEIVGSSTHYSFVSTLPEGDSKTRTINSTIGLVGEYPGAEGVKPGWTPWADAVLVTQATILGHTLDVVVMGAEDMSRAEQDSSDLLDFGFLLEYGFQVDVLSDRVTTSVGVYDFSSRTFTVNGTTANDAIDIVRSPEWIGVSVNGVQEVFPMEDIVVVEITADAGQDTISVQGSGALVKINAGTDVDTITLDDAPGVHIQSGVEEDIIIVRGNSSPGLQLLDGTGPDVLRVMGTSSGDDVTLRRWLGQLQLIVNDSAFNVPVNQLSRLDILTGTGSDEIEIKATDAALPVVVDAGEHDDTIRLYGFSGLNHIGGSITVEGRSGGSDLLRIDDSGRSGGGRTWTLSSDRISWSAVVEVHYEGVGNIELYGSNYADTFIVQSTDAASQVDIHARYGVDQVVGPNRNHTWTISGHNSGRFSNVNFTSFENLKGGLYTDSFKFFGGRVSGNIDGGGGYYDMLWYFHHDQAVTIDLQSAQADLIGGTFANVERIQGSVYQDTLIAPNLTNSWFVNFYADNLGTLSNSLGNWRFYGIENLVGGNQRDSFLLAGQRGVSGRIDGEGGVDTLDYSQSSTGVTVDLAANTATRVAQGITNIEDVTGSDYNDTLLGDENDNVLIGRAGDDILVGRAGNDILSSQDGRNLLIGGDGVDGLFGGDDEDLLIAGYTTYDMNPAALLAIHNAWSDRTVSYKQRIQTLKSGLNHNGSTLWLSKYTIQNDHDSDILTGEGAADWFWSSGGDSTDRDPDRGEQAS